MGVSKTEPDQPTRYFVMHAIKAGKVPDIIKAKWHGSPCLPLEWLETEIEAT